MKSLLGNSLGVDLLTATIDRPLISRKDQNPSFSSLINGSKDEIITDNPSDKASIDETEDKATGLAGIPIKKEMAPFLHAPVHLPQETVSLAVIDISERGPVPSEADSYQPSLSAEQPKDTLKEASGQDSLSEKMIGFVVQKEASPFPLSVIQNVIGYADQSVESSHHLGITAPTQSQIDSTDDLDRRDRFEMSRPNNMKALDPLALAEPLGMSNTTDENASISVGKVKANLNGKTSSIDPTAELRQTQTAHSKAAKNAAAYKEAMLYQTAPNGAIDTPSSNLNRSPVATQADMQRLSTVKDPLHPALVNFKATNVQNPKAKDQHLSFDASTKNESTDPIVLMKNPSGAAADFHHNEQKNRSAVLDSPQGTAKGEFMPSRAAITQIHPLMGKNEFELNHPAEINTQSLINKILDAKQSMNNTSGRVRIILDPPNLGPVNLDILVRNDVVDVVMTTDNTGVQQALQSRADDIRIALQRQDFRIENFQVLLHQNSSTHQQSFGGNTFGHTDNNREEKTQDTEGTTVKPFLGATNSHAETIQGLVSVFV